MSTLTKRACYDGDADDRRRERPQQDLAQPWMPPTEEQLSAWRPKKKKTASEQGRKVNMTDYRKRMLIPHDGHPTMKLFTVAGLLLARGYVRVEFGGRGPYVEMTDAQIQKVNVHSVEFATDKKKHAYKHVDFYELRSNCKSSVMVYLQRRTVDYARYRIGFYYVSPFDLRDESGNEIVASLESRQPSLF